jgi:hypothetical protein
MYVIDQEKGDTMPFDLNALLNRNENLFHLAVILTSIALCNQSK